jgi:uncharacterized protein (DUF433 family)
MMRLEDYFDFLGTDDIRIKGHRIGIDDVLSYYLEGFSAEEIGARFPSLKLEEIHATITYYLHNRTEVDALLARLGAWRDQRYQATIANPSPLAQRLRELKARRQEQPA